ncbi:MAG: S-layer homology domain-containing protein [Peptoniphilus sp.]|nr:S-layer homology domain-containing protein [Peptoniphilus sp.]
MKKRRFVGFILLCLIFIFNKQEVFATDIELTSDQDINEVVNAAEEGDKIIINDGGSHELTTSKDKIDITVRDGHLTFNNAVITNTNAISFEGPDATGTIKGGRIISAKRRDGIVLKDGAHIDTIENVEIIGDRYPIYLKGNSRIGEIKSGTFKNGNNKGSLEPIDAVVNVRESTIDKISGGRFISVNDAAILVGNGSRIGEISGGTYLCEVDTDEYNYNEYRFNYFSAVVLYVNNASGYPDKGASIGEISGGTFQGLHAIYMVSAKVGQYTTIDEISGGTFRNIDKIEGKNLIRHTLYTSQRAKIGEISGGIFEATDADAVHLTFNYYPNNKTEPTTIGRIADAKFRATGRGHAILINHENYSIDLIENGEFLSGDKSIYAVEARAGRIGEIKKGIFWGGIKTANGVNDPTKIELPISELKPQPEEGEGRYYHEEIDNALIGVRKEFLSGAFELPKYTTEEGLEYSYIPSVYNKDYKVWQEGHIGFYENKKDTELNKSEYFFWSSDPVGYFNTVEKEGSYSFSDNDYFENYDRKEERIYGLYPEYNDPDGALKRVDVDNHAPSSYMMGYLRKRPLLKFDANLPDRVKYTGELPATQHMVPFKWDNWDNDISYDEQGKHWEQVFLVPKEPGITAEGYKFLGWNTEADGSGRNLKLDKFYAMPLEDVTLYAQWEAPEKDIIFPPIIYPWTKPDYNPVGSLLIEDSKDIEEPEAVERHIKYLVGYEDSTFRPENNMTREEVAVMFSRLLKDKFDSQETYWSSFADVSKDRWSADAIAHTNRFGVIEGYPDNTFKPEQAITRAEFLAMAVRFEPLGEGNKTFEDVPETHWAYEIISKGATAGWINGYPDGKFRPEDKITRAEVTKIVNKMLNRSADKDFINANKYELITYWDLADDHWAYYDVEEATNSHEYVRKSGVDELWKRIINTNL